MKIFLFILAAIAFLSGVVAFGDATSAMHEVYAGLMMATAAICLSGAGIIEAVNRLRSELVPREEPTTES